VYGQTLLFIAKDTYCIFLHYCCTSDALWRRDNRV